MRFIKLYCTNLMSKRNEKLDMREWNEHNIHTKEDLYKQLSQTSPCNLIIKIRFELTQSCINFSSTGRPVVINEISKEIGPSDP